MDNEVSVVQVRELNYSDECGIFFKSILGAQKIPGTLPGIFKYFR